MNEGRAPPRLRVNRHSRNQDVRRSTPATSMQQNTFRFVPGDPVTHTKVLRCNLT